MRLKAAGFIQPLKPEMLYVMAWLQRLLSNGVNLCRYTGGITRACPRCGA
jgi:hypothetical protein